MAILPTAFNRLGAARRSTFSTRGEGKIALSLAGDKVSPTGYG
jgi:hypothetical protein